VEDFGPGVEVLGGDLGDGDHAGVDRGLVFDDGVDADEVGDAEFGFVEAADVGGEDGDAAAHGLEDDAGAGLGPDGGDEHDLGLVEEAVDVVHLGQERDVGQGPHGVELRRLGAPGGDGGELNGGELAGEAEEDVDALDGARVDHGDEGVGEAAEEGEFGDGFEE